MSDVNTDHILAVAQIIGLFIIEVVDIFPDRHKSGSIRTDLQLASAGNCPDQLIPVPNLIPVFCQRFIVNTTLTQDKILNNIYSITPIFPKNALTGCSN